MNEFMDKIKLPLAIILSAGLIIGLSAVISTVYQGRFSSITSVNENVSEIATDVEITVAESLAEIDNLFIPEKIKNQMALKIETTKCKQYTEYKVFSATDTVTVRSYNYAYLTEDDSVSFPADTEKININGTDIFVFTQNGISTALYYKGLVRYIIETNADIINIFS